VVHLEYLGKERMHLLLSLLSAPLALFGGLGAPEVILCFVILAVLFGGRAVSVAGRLRDCDGRLTREEIHILLFIAGMVAIGIGLLVSQEYAR
jgi:hypothetical protein